MGQIKQPMKLKIKNSNLINLLKILKSWSEILCSHWKSDPLHNSFGIPSSFQQKPFTDLWTCRNTRSCCPTSSPEETSNYRILPKQVSPVEVVTSRQGKYLLCTKTYVRSPYSSNAISALVSSGRIVSAEDRFWGNPFTYASQRRKPLRVKSWPYELVTCKKATIYKWVAFNWARVDLKL